MTAATKSAERAREISMPIEESPVRQPLDRGQGCRDTQMASAPVDPFLPGHREPATQSIRAGEDLRTIYDDLADGYLKLRLWSEMLADNQQTRIGMENRVRSATVDSTPYLIHVEGFKVVEHKVALDLVRTYRKVAPAGVIAWQKETLGIGEHLLARLLGTLGHPRLTVAHAWADNPKFKADEPSSTTNPKRVLVIDGDPFLRSVGQLWQYCGHGAPERKRKGMTQDEALGLGSPRCKMLVHLLAQSCLKAGGYRDVYDDAKAHYLAKEFTKGHAHNCALRKMGKELLRDMWKAAG